MSYSSELTKERILNSAKKEFLEKGFINANLRTIASSAKVTTGALYRHFESKDALFYTIVEEVYESTIELLKATDDIENIKERISTNSIEKGYDRMKPFFDFIYSNLDEFKLLLLHSKGSKTSDFLDNLTEMYTESNMNFLQKAYISKASKRIPSRESVHFLTNGFLNAIFEIVIHDIPWNQAEEYIKDIGRFQYYGWNGLIGIYDKNAT